MFESRSLFMASIKIRTIINIINIIITLTLTLIIEGRLRALGHGTRGVLHEPPPAFQVTHKRPIPLTGAWV